MVSTRIVDPGGLTRIRHSRNNRIRIRPPRNNRILIRTLRSQTEIGSGSDSRRTIRIRIRILLNFDQISLTFNFFLSTQKEQYNWIINTVLYPGFTYRVSHVRTRTHEVDLLDGRTIELKLQTIMFIVTWWRIVLIQGQISKKNKKAWLHHN